MPKKIHFLYDNGKIACGKKTNKLKTSTNYYETTCEHCIEFAAAQFTMFTCPACNKDTNSFTLIESVITESIVLANDKARTRYRRDKFCRNRELMGIKCPICNITTPVIGKWSEMRNQFGAKSR